MAKRIEKSVLQEQQFKQQYPSAGERYAHWLGKNSPDEGGIGTLRSLISDPKKLTAYQNGLRNWGNSNG